MVQFGSAIKNTRRSKTFTSKHLYVTSLSCSKSKFMYCICKSRPNSSYIHNSDSELHCYVNLAALLQLIQCYTLLIEINC